MPTFAPRPKVIIADDHTLVAEACKQLLEPEYDVVATVGDGRTLVDVATTLKPQVIIVDISMPLLNGLDAGQQIKKTIHSVKLVYLTMNQDADLAAEAFRCGAAAYLSFRVPKGSDACTTFPAIIVSTDSMRSPLIAAACATRSLLSIVSTTPLIRIRLGGFSARAFSPMTNANNKDAISALRMIPSEADLSLY